MHLAVTGLVGWQILATAVSGPDYLSFFNTACGGPLNGRRVLLDSNLDWGQDLKRATAWRREAAVERPFLACFGHVDPILYDLDYALPAAKPVAGTYLVSATYLHRMPYPATWVGRPRSGSTSPGCSTTSSQPESADRSSSFESSRPGLDPVQAAYG